MAFQTNEQFNAMIRSNLWNNLFVLTPTLEIYKGTVPGSGDISTWSAYKPSRSADLLVTMPNARISNGVNAIIFDTGRPDPTNASATGVATWAAWELDTSGGIIGDVTEAGGGGLFILDSTALTLGGLVTVIGFRMKW